MGAIVDTLYLGAEELSTLKAAYPACRVINKSHSDFKIQRYQVIIPHEENCYDSYYIFLIDNGIAMSSKNFVGRIASDKRFVERMRSRITELESKGKRRFTKQPEGEGVYGERVCAFETEEACPPK